MSETSARDRSRHSTGYDIAFFIALLATALALGGALAHLLELPNKIGMSQDDYFTVQQVYRGWNLLGILLAVELAAMLAVIVMSWGDRRVLWPAVIAVLCLVAAQTVFWVYTFPANVATQNWTRIPPDWEDLRRQWEYSHAVGAGFQMLAMCALIVAVLARGRRYGSASSH